MSESGEDRNDRTDKERKEKWRGIVGKYHGSFLCCQQKGPTIFLSIFFIFRLKRHSKTYLFGYSLVKYTMS